MLNRRIEQPRPQIDVTISGTASDTLAQVGKKQVGKTGWIERELLNYVLGLKGTVGMPKPAAAAAARSGAAACGFS